MIRNVDTIPMCDTPTMICQIKCPNQPQQAQNARRKFCPPQMHSNRLHLVKAQRPYPNGNSDNKHSMRYLPLLKPSEGSHRVIQLVKKRGIMGIGQQRPKLRSFEQAKLADMKTPVVSTKSRFIERISQGTNNQQTNVSDLDNYGVAVSHNLIAAENTHKVATKKLMVTKTMLPVSRDHCYVAPKPSFDSQSLSQLAELHKTPDKRSPTPDEENLIDISDLMSPQAQSGVLMQSPSIIRKRRIRTKMLSNPIKNTVVVKKSIDI